MLVISNVHLNDIENFTLCSKQLRGLCKKRLRVQYARKRSFSTIAIGHVDNLHWDEDQPERGVHPILALRDIITEPPNWLYTKTLLVGCRVEQDDNDPLDYEDQEEAEIDEIELEDTVATLQSNTRLLNKVLGVQRCLYSERGETEFKLFARTQRWIRLILSGAIEAAAFLLIAILPNLHTLRFVDGYQEQRSTHFTKLTKLLRTALSERHHLMGITLFSKLTEVGAHGLDAANGFNYDIFEGFMALPSMRKIKGRVVSGEYCRRRFFQPSEVTSLEFFQSSITSACFAESLRVIKGLQKFTYDFWADASTDQDSQKLLWEPRQTVRALEIHTKKTLRHLEITGSPGTRDPHTGDFPYLDFENGEPFIGSLCAFKVLEKIRVETMMLYKEVKVGNPWARQSGHKLWLKQESWLPIEEEKKGPNALVEPERLVEFLPASVHRLRLVGGLSKTDAPAMLEDLAVLKDKCLPNLVSIFFEDVERSEIDGHLVKECEDAGIRMKFWQPSA